jgi:hypothetical protein
LFPSILAEPILSISKLAVREFTIQQVDTGEFKIYDPGSAYDIRQCACTFELDAEEQAKLVQLLNSSSYGRGSAAVTLTLPTGSGFHPFGPDKGDTGDFTVAMQLISARGIGEAPYLYFHTDVLLTNQSTFPTYTIVDDVDEGSWTFGTIAGMRMPTGWFQPMVHYAVDGQLQRNGIVQFVDRGQSGDHYETSFGLVMNEAKAARLIAYLTDSVRATQFTITPGSGMYPFGYDLGTTGAMDVRLIQTRIELTHELYNRFTCNIQLSHED